MTQSRELTGIVRDAAASHGDGDCCCCLSFVFLQLFWLQQRENVELGEKYENASIQNTKQRETRIS